MKSGIDKLGHYWILEKDKEYTCGICEDKITQGDKAYEFYQQKNKQKLTLCHTCMQNIKIAKKL